MTYLSWDESRRLRVSMACGFADVNRDIARERRDLPRELNGYGEYRMNCCRCFALPWSRWSRSAAISLGLGNALAQSPAPTASPAAARRIGNAAPRHRADPGSGRQPAGNATAAPQPPATAARRRPPRRCRPPIRSARKSRWTPKTVVVLKGNANWDSAFDTLIESFKSLSALLDKQGIKPSGNPMIVYTSTDDTGFTYLAEIPVDQEPKNLTKAMSMGKSPDGKALKFVHRGSYDNMDNTYEAITNHLDDKKLEAKDTFIEEYITDPLKTAEDKLVINVYVPLK